MPAFNERLRNQREKAGLTQEALARAADLSLSSITKLERGGMDPSWSTIQKLARALGVTCEAFMEDAAGSEPAPKRGRGGKVKGK